MEKKGILSGILKRNVKMVLAAHTHIEMNTAEWRELIDTRKIPGQ